MGDYAGADVSFMYSLLDRLKSDVLYHIGYGGRNLSIEKLVMIFDEMYTIWDALDEKPAWLSREQIDILFVLSTLYGFGVIESVKFPRSGKSVSFEERVGSDSNGKWVYKTRIMKHSDAVRKSVPFYLLSKR